MSIDQIKGNSYSSRPAKSNSTAKAGGANKSGANAAAEGSNNQGQKDSLSLSGSSFATEVDFIKSILGNSGKSSLKSLQEVKKKIESGVYDSEAVQKEVGARIDEELSRLHQVLNQPAEKSDTDSTISSERREQLLNDPKVTQKVAEGIAENLKDI